MSAIATSAALFGEKSLKERFGDLQGRELQSKIFESYMVPWTKSDVKGIDGSDGLFDCFQRSNCNIPYVTVTLYITRVSGILKKYAFVKFQLYCTVFTQIHDQKMIRIDLGREPETNHPNHPRFQMHKHLCAQCHGSCLTVPETLFAIR